MTGKHWGAAIGLALVVIIAVALYDFVGVGNLVKPKALIKAKV